MGVKVERKLYAGVPGKALDILRVRAASKQDCEAGMPEIVPADSRETRTPPGRCTRQATSPSQPVGYRAGVLRGSGLYAILPHGRRKAGRRWGVLRLVIAVVVIVVLVIIVLRFI